MQLFQMMSEEGPGLETVPEYSTICTTGTDTLTTNTPVSGHTHGHTPELVPVSRPKRKMATHSAYTDYTLPVHQQMCEPNQEENDADISSPTTPSGQRKSFLENFRPRSKSDAYAKQKRSSFLNQLKLKKTKHVSHGDKVQNLTIFSCATCFQASAGHTNRPLSPLVGINVDQENNYIKTSVQGGGHDLNDQDSQDPKDGSVTPTRKSPEAGEFRARAASAGQQAKAHAMQIVARFRNRSNTSSDDKDRKRYKIVGHVSPKDV